MWRKEREEIKGREREREPERESINKMAISVETTFIGLLLLWCNQNNCERG